jgi:hypothetical protein
VQDSTVHQHGASTGVVAGLAVAGTLIAVLILAVAILLARRRKRRRRQSAAAIGALYGDEKRATEMITPDIIDNRSARKSFFGRWSIARSADTSIKSPPPIYANDEDSVTALNGRGIHELSSSTPVNQPAELAAETLRAELVADETSSWYSNRVSAISGGATVGERYDPAREHTMSWAQHGAEQDDVGELGGTLLFGHRTRDSGGNRESWTTYGSGARMSMNDVPSVIIEDEGGSGITR